MTQASPVVASRAAEAVQLLRAQRDEVLTELGRLADDDCRYPATWAGVNRSVNFLLRAFSLHEIDHLQHLQKLLRARGRNLSEAQLLLAKAQALRGELEALVLSLSDEAFEASGPDEGDWSVRQLVDHLRQTDATYLRDAREALARGRAGAAAT